MQSLILDYGRATITVPQLASLSLACVCVCDHGHVSAYLSTLCHWSMAPLMTVQLPHCTVAPALESAHAMR